MLRLASPGCVLGDQDVRSPWHCPAKTDVLGLLCPGMWCWTHKQEAPRAGQLPLTLSVSSKYPTGLVPSFPAPRAWSHPSSPPFLSPGLLLTFQMHLGAVRIISWIWVLPLNCTKLLLKLSRATSTSPVCRGPVWR